MYLLDEITEEEMTILRNLGMYVGFDPNMHSFSQYWDMLVAFRNRLKNVKLLRLAPLSEEEKVLIETYDSLVLKYGPMPFDEFTVEEVDKLGLAVISHRGQHFPYPSRSDYWQHGTYVYRKVQAGKADKSLETQALYDIVCNLIRRYPVGKVQIEPPVSDKPYQKLLKIVDHL